MKSIKQEYPTFIETDPKALKQNIELFLIQLPADFDISKLQNLDPTTQDHTELEQDQQKTTVVDRITGQAQRNLSSQIMPITYDSKKKTWQIKRKFKGMYKLSEVYKIPKIKKKAYRKVLPRSLKSQK